MILGCFVAEIAQNLNIYIANSENCLCLSLEWLFTGIDQIQKQDTMQKLTDCIACSLRKIFIDERRSKDAATGPTDAQAAQIMGNSEEAWDRHYDLNCSLRESQAAADATKGWREQMLMKSKQEIVTLSDSSVDSGSVEESDEESELVEESESDVESIEIDID